uniref:tRNA (adenine(58)-N(1))-methyltransferase n=1 Tax=Mola mola TaxID=94237 RepID=A0A3Q3W396_MOLML
MTHLGEIISLGWLGKVLVSPWRSWWKWPGRGASGSPCSGCCPRDPDPDKRQKTKRNYKVTRHKKVNPVQEELASHLASDAPLETNTSGPDEAAGWPTLPGESLLAFGELLVAEYLKKQRVEFRKMFQLQSGARLQSSWGILQHDHIVGQPAGRFLKTGRGVPIFIRRASLEDYVLFMKRGPAISYPKDAAIMLQLMDVTEGDCVLESGSGSGAMSLFLSRAVGSKGSVLSVEVREDHRRRAVLNYSRWRTAWSLRRGKEWPDNVHFHNADLCTASTLLAAQGFHAVRELSTETETVFKGAVHLKLKFFTLCLITQVIDLLEGLRCLALPLLCERIIEVPARDWLVAPALQKDGSYCIRRAPMLHEQRGGEEDKTLDETYRAFASIPYIARPHPEQMSHTGQT